MCSKYREWMSKQDVLFQKFVHKKDIPIKFVSEDIIGITLTDLEQLDNYFVNNSPEGRE